jgi:hypothetical protein
MSDYGTEPAQCPICKSDVDHCFCDTQEFWQRIEELEAKLEQRGDSFDLYHQAEMRAVKYWQKHHPDQTHVWPDKMKMSVWLLERIAKLEAVVKELMSECGKCFADSDTRRRHAKAKRVLYEDKQ